MVTTRGRTTSSRPAKKARVSKQKDQDEEPYVEETEKQPNYNELMSIVTNPQARVTGGPMTGGHMIVKSKRHRTPEDVSWVNKIRNKVKALAFGSCKFIRDDKKLIHTTARVFDLWNFKEFEGLSDQAYERAQQTWVENNKEGVREACLHLHNCIQGQVRDLVVSMVVDGQKVPTPKQILMCATRDVTLRDHANHWIFMLHWDDFLPRVVGTEAWGKKHRHNCAISKATVDFTKDGQKCISESTEACFVALYESCYEKWLHMGNQKAANKKEKVVVDRKANEMESKFIKANRGQSTWGGWTNEGVDYFTEVRKKVKKSRDKDHVEGMESDFLDRIRMANGLVDENGKELKKLAKGKAIDQHEDRPIDEEDEL